MPNISPWHLRARTAEAMAGLAAAKAVIALVPLARWRNRFGRAGTASADQLAEARQLAAHVRRGAARLPIPAKCLPQALALSWMLRRRRIAHRLTIAVRPTEARSSSDNLHAWIEMDGVIVLGELPGPWLALFNLP